MQARVIYLTRPSVLPGTHRLVEKDKRSVLLYEERAMERPHTHQCSPSDQKPQASSAPTVCTPEHRPQPLFLDPTDYCYLLEVREVSMLCGDDVDRFLQILEARGLLTSHTAI